MSQVCAVRLAFATAPDCVKPIQKGFINAINPLRSVLKICSLTLLPQKGFFFAAK